MHGQYPIFDNLVNAYDENFFLIKTICQTHVLILRQSPFNFIENIKYGMVQFFFILFISQMKAGDMIIFYESLRHIESITSNFMVNKTFKNHMSKTIIELKKK